MIPLVRPEFPNLKSVERNLQPAWNSKQFTNFGAVFDRCVNELSHLTGGFTLPVTSGTTAIQVCLSLFGLRGKRVAVPDYTHSGTLLAIVQAGGIPVLFGVNSETWTLEVSELKKHAHEFDAVVVVSPFGYYLNVNAWEEFSVEYDVPVVYDMAGAFGHFPKTRNPLCYSFHSTKNFGVGEGGCIVFPNKEQWSEAQRIINFGTLPDRNIQNTEGLNAKIDELKAACILSALEPDMISKIWRKIQSKQALLKFYKDQLPGSFVPVGPKKPSLCVLGNLPAAEIEERGKAESIICRRYYPLLSKMNLEVPIVTHSSGSMNYCVALPSDASLQEAYKVVEFVKRVCVEVGWIQR